MIAAALLWVALAWAEDEESETVTGSRPPPLSTVPTTPSTEPAPAPPPQSSSAWPANVVRGATALGMDVDVVGRCNEGIQALYKRDYKTARASFDALAGDPRIPGISPVGQALIYQSLMLENFDFRYEGPYLSAAKKGRAELEAALAVPGQEAIENFLLAGLLGVDAIHTLRKGDYLVALNRGYDAMKAVHRSQEAAPGFVDPLLGDGIYNYWRTVVTMSSSLLPDFGDHRVEGISQMARVESQGVFLAPAATMALTFTWMEEGEHKKALASALKNRAAYPNNVINNLLVGRIYLNMRKYDSAEQALRQVLRVAPDNQRAHYYLGRVHLRQRRHPEALAEINLYLSFKDLSDSFRAEGYHVKGDIYYRQELWREAELAYAEAWRLGKLKRSKTRLDMAKERQKTAK